MSSEHGRKASKQGSKGKYAYWLTDDGLTLLEGWSRDGLTQKQIATEKIHVAETTLIRWMEQFPQIMQALKKGKELPDIMVENALFKSAIGYYVEEQEDKVDIHGNVVPTKKTRYVPPSTTAQIFWLKNRRPDKWADKPIAPIPQTEKQDDGLMKALTDKVEDVFDSGDDSDVLPKENA